MSNFRSGNQSRDRRDFPRRDFGDRDSRRPQLYEAVCAECGKTCQVPFRPSGERPVYCSECFGKKGGKDNNGSRDRRDPSRRSFGDRDSRRLSQSNTDNCGVSQLAEEIEGLNAKLDQIIDLLSPVEKKQPEPAGEKAGKTEKLSIIKESKAVRKLAPVEEEDIKEK